MLRVLLSLALALFVGLSTASAQDAEKKECPKKTAAKKKEKAQKTPLTDEQKAERAKKRAAKMLKAKDKNGDGALTFEELTAKPARKKPAKKERKKPAK